jgi:hypothetical protein
MTGRLAWPYNLSFYPAIRRTGPRESAVFKHERERIVQRWHVTRYQFMMLFTGNGIMLISPTLPTGLCFWPQLGSRDICGVCPHNK